MYTNLQIVINIKQKLECSWIYFNIIIKQRVKCLLAFVWILKKTWLEKDQCSLARLGRHGLAQCFAEYNSRACFAANVTKRYSIFLILWWARLIALSMCLLFIMHACVQAQYWYDRISYSHIACSYTASCFLSPARSLTVGLYTSLWRLFSTTSSFSMCKCPRLYKGIIFLSCPKHTWGSWFAAINQWPCHLSLILIHNLTYVNVPC